MSQSNFDEGLRAALSHLSELEDAGSSAVILIDGRAGSGKTLFASSLVDHFFKEHSFLPKLVAMDDLYPGWEGLRAGSVYLNERILQPLAAGREASWQLWDWQRGTRGRQEPGNGFRQHSPGSPLIVEGCGSLGRENSALATFRIWIDSEPDIRRARFSSRDSGAFDDYFGIWAAQEDDFYGENRPEELSDLRIRN